MKADSFYTLSAVQIAFELAVALQNFPEVVLYSVPDCHNQIPPNTGYITDGCRTVDSPLRFIWFAGSGAVSAQEHFAVSLPCLGDPLLHCHILHSQFPPKMDQRMVRSSISPYRAIAFSRLVLTVLFFIIKSSNIECAQLRGC